MQKKRGLIRRIGLSRLGKKGRARREAMEEMRPLIWGRCRGICEVCSEPLPRVSWDPHHVLPSGRGGTDEIHNLIAVHRRCHRWIHEHPQMARELGLLR